MSSDILSSRIAVAAAKLESTAGTAVFPAAANMINVTTAPDITQVRPNVNSEERRNSRGVTAQFQSALDPGTWNWAMYLRPAGTAATEANVGDPQGADVVQSLFGKRLTASGILINGASVDDVVTTIPFDTLTGTLPAAGVIKVESELIYYSGITYTSSTAGSFTGCTRGYGGTTAAAHIDDTPIGVWSLTFAQTVNVPSFTAYVRQDSIFKMLTGATPDTASLDISNSGGSTMTVSGQGMLMYVLGEHTTNATAANGATSYSTATPKRAEVGMYVQNTTKSDDNGGSGYLITAIDGNTVTITPGIVAAAGWDSGDTIEGFLPEFESIGTPTENRQTVMRVDDSVFPVRNTTLSISEPKTYPNDEVGSDGPTSYFEGQREITIDINVYVRADTVEEFKDTFDGVEKAIEVTYGVGLGNQIVLPLPRVKYSTATISEDGDAWVMNLTGTALDTVAEDSLTMRFE